MSSNNHKIKMVKLDELVPFHLHKGQTYQGERLAQLIESIKQSGLISPVTVRRLNDKQYEIICGHNRVAAMKTLGRSSISAYVLNNTSAADASRLYYDSNLNQQTFSDWSYSQKLDAIRYVDQQVRLNSRQGQRTDIQKETELDKNATSVHTGQKPNKKSATTTRDKMSRQLGIATSTFGKYRSIIKLDEEVVTAIGRLLDNRRITFEAAYRLSKLRPEEVKILIDHLEKNTDEKFAIGKLKELCTKSKASDSILSEEEMLSVLGLQSDHDTVHATDENQ